MDCTLVKTVTFSAPCFNEEANIELFYEEVKSICEELPIKWKILFIDNDSTDNTRIILKQLAAKDKRVLVILNRQNVGVEKNTIYGLFVAPGDAVVPIPSDRQIPLKSSVPLINMWLGGEKLVIGVKEKSYESFFMSLLRSLYYKALNGFADGKVQIQSTGYGIYDRTVIEEARELLPTLRLFRAIPSELGYDYNTVPFTLEKREHGRSSASLFYLIHYTIFSLISSNRPLDKLFISIGLIVSFLSVFIGAVFFALKLLYWEQFATGIAPLIISIYFLFGITFFIMGIICAQVNLVINNQIQKPLVREEERLNF